MKLGTWMIVGAFCVAAPAWAAPIAADDVGSAKYLTIVSKQVTVSDDSDNPLLFEMQEGKSLAPSSGEEQIIREIINLGKEIWKFIEDNKPVVNIAVDSANALPACAQSWRDLDGWQVPRSKVYRVAYKNGFDMTVIEFAFRVIYTYGGGLAGAGKYLTNVTVIPKTVSVAWGYTFNAHVKIPSIVNTGTQADPLAGMELLVEWSIDTTVKHIQQSASFFVKGDGEFFNLTDGLE